MRNIVCLLIFFSFLKIYSQNNVPTDRLIQKEKIGTNNEYLKINGFYYSKRVNIKSENDTAKYISPMIFFEDGTVLTFDFIGNSSNTLKIKENGEKCILKPRQDFNTIINYFKCYAEIVDIKKIYTVYSIDDNFIRIQSVAPKFFVEKRGVILNDSTFVINQSINYMTRKFENKSYMYQFQTSKKPDSTDLEPNSEIQRYFLK